MRVMVLGTLLLLLAVPHRSQDVTALSETGWKREQASDPLRGTTFSQFTLTGKFLTERSGNSPKFPPAMVVRCIPGKSMRGKTNGKFASGFILVGGVLNSTVSDTGNSLVRVEYRLDDGKLQSDSWGRSTDFPAIFMAHADCELCGSGYDKFANLLYGHHTYHKENSSPQIKKIVLGVPEFLGGEIVMQFDLPDSTEVADACGIILHK